MSDGRGCADERDDLSAGKGCRVGWVKFDESFPGHPKVMSLSDAAFRLYVESICHAGWYLTDGHVTAVWVGRRRKRAATELVTQGLWENDGNDYMIHDYLDWQRSRKAVEDDRRRDATRKRRQRRDDDGRYSTTDGYPDDDRL